MSAKRKRESYSLRISLNNAAKTKKDIREVIGLLKQLEIAAKNANRVLPFPGIIK